MSQDSIKLERELKFIEGSFKSGIISRSEFEQAKERVEDKLAKARAEEKEEPVKEEVKRVENRVIVEKPVEKTPQVESTKVHTEPTKVATKSKERLKLETYGKSAKKPKKSSILIIGAAILLVIVLFLSFNSGNKDSLVKIPVDDNLPVCGSDLDCYKPGFTGICENPGTEDALCTFEESVKINIQVIVQKDCPVCDIGRMQNTLNQLYPGATYEIVDASDAEEIISKFDINVLPAFVLGDDVEDTARFDDTKSTLIKKGNSYLFKPSATGSPYFFNNKEVNENVVLFLDPFSSASQKAFDNLLSLREIQDFDYELVFFTRNSLDESDTEIYELFRQICIREESSKKITDYLTCLFDKGVSEETCSECLLEVDISGDDIGFCVENNGKKLLSLDLKRAKDFDINTAPVFIVNNQFKKGGTLSTELLEEFYCKINDC